jgi:hypothetical protein
MTEKIVDAIKKAKEAVDRVDNLDDEQKKIAFQTILSELLRSGEKTPKSQKGQEPLVTVVNETESIEELYNRMAPRGHTNTTMFLAYYYYQNKKTFITNDILIGFKKILVIPPANVKDIINKNRKKGFIMDVGPNDKGHSIMQITRLGIRYVENGFRRDGNGNS